MFYYCNLCMKYSRGRAVGHQQQLKLTQQRHRQLASSQSTRNTCVHGWMRSLTSQRRVHEEMTASRSKSDNQSFMSRGLLLLGHFNWVHKQLTLDTGLICLLFIHLSFTSYPSWVTGLKRIPAAIGISNCKPHSFAMGSLYSPVLMHFFEQRRLKRHW